MVKSGTLARSPEAYSPNAYNPDAFNMVVYSRPQNHPELMFFPRRPESGLLTFEEVMSSGGAREMPAGAGTSPRALDAKFTAEVLIAEQDSCAGAVVPFLESCYPMAVMFNTATGAWTSGQAKAAVAAADRTNVFRALEGMPSQTDVPIVVESPTGLGKALESVAASSQRALVQSSVAPMCTDMRIVETGQLPASYIAIYEAATKTATGNSLIVSPFMGLKDAKPEICCDGIFANGELAFSVFSEKARVSSKPPYEDLRIVTSDDLGDDIRRAAIGVATEVAARLGVRHCVFHAEFWITDNGPQLSDFMTRPGGGFIPEMVMAKCGVDLRAGHVYACFGMVGDLVNLAGKAKATADQFAIGSLSALGESSDATMTEADRKALASDERVLAYSFVNEFSNSAVGTNDFRGALCVRGPSSQEAVNLLDRIAVQSNLN